MSGESDNRRVIVLTGAAGVLGRAMGIALLRAGHRVVLTDLHRAGLQRVVDLSGAQREHAAICTADLTSPTGPQDVVDAAVTAFGHIDMLINNAALTGFAAWPEANSRPKPWKLDMGLVRRFFDINMIATQALTTLVVPGLIERGWGRIVNVTCSYDTMQRIFPYGATKAALEAYTAAVEMELGNTGVTANTLNPGGPIATEEHVAKNPGRTWVQAEVMNAPVLWLASDASNGVGGRRYVGLLWNSSLAPQDALAQASGPFAWHGFGEEAVK